MEEANSNAFVNDEFDEMVINNTWDIEGKLWIDHAFNIYYYFEEAFIFFIAVLTIMMAVLAIYYVWRCKKMQNQLNIMLCTIMMCGIWVQLTSIDTIRILYSIFNFINYKYYCLWHGMLPAFMCAEVMAAFMITLDCAAPRIRKKTFKFILIVIWTHFVICLILKGIACIFGVDVVSLYLFLFLSTMHALLLLKSLWYLLQVIRKAATKDQHYRNAIVGYYLVTVMLTIFGLIADYHLDGSILALPCRVFTLSYFCHTLVIIYVVTRHDENFKKLFVNALNCKWYYIQATLENQEDIDDGNTLVNEDALESVILPDAAEDNPIVISENIERNGNINNCQINTS